MADKTFKSRIIHKHDTEANWLDATSFIPKRGEIIIYDIDSTHTYERFKIGDGEKTVIALPFADDTKVDKISGKGLSTNDYTTAEKNKLSGIATGANKTVVDSAISESSANPVQNKVVKEYVDSRFEDMVGDKKVSLQISEAIASKVDKVDGKGLSTNDYTTTEKNKLSGISSGAEVNQNAFSNIAVGSTTIAADGKTDTLTLSGSNVTLTPDATNDKVTIGITKDNVTAALGYTPPTTDTTYSAAGSSLGLVKSGGDVSISSGVITVNDDSHNHTIDNVDGLREHIGEDSVQTQINTAIAAKADASHSHDAATTSAAGFMSASDKTKLNGIATGANKTTVDSALSSTSTNPVQNKVVQSALAGKSDTTHSHDAATASAAGLMSASDKTKLDGIATGANKITVDSSLSSTSTNPVQNKVVNTAISNLNTLVGDTAVATQISNAVSSKQDTITGAATTITGSNLTASRALISNSNGKVAVSAVTSTELGYLDGVTSAIQTQLNGKSDSSHTHSAYVNQNAFGNVTVGSTTIAADSTTDTLTLVAGDNVTLTPDATNDKITIAATDTKYTHPSYTARTGVPTANATPGFGGTFNVSQPVSDATGHITAINSRTITIPSAVATTSTAGLMSADDKTIVNGVGSKITTLGNEIDALEQKVDAHIAEVITPSAIGAIDSPVLIGNLDELLTSGVPFGFYFTGSSTLGTPYKAGLTGYASAVVMSYASSANNGMQIAFSSGSDKIFVRANSGGTIGSWKSITMS